MTYGSSHRMWESNVQTWENPSASARLASSITRNAGGVVCSTIPMSMERHYRCALQAVKPTTRRNVRCQTPNVTVSGRWSRRRRRAGGRSSAGFGEAEVDGARGRVGPTTRHDLAAGVEVDALGPVHVGVAEQARLPASEAVV